MTIQHRRRTKVQPKRGKRARSLDKARLNLLIDPELKEWAHGYASRYHTSLSAIITHHFVTLKEREAKPDVQQI
jgi:hypothetical protein